MSLLIPRIIGSSRFRTRNFSRMFSYGLPVGFSRTIATNPAPPHDDLFSVFTDEVSESILSFWFADTDLHPTKGQAQRWFVADNEFDEQCQSKFGSLLSTLTTHPQPSIVSLASSPERALSLVLLLDQFPRNIFRGDLSAKVYTETDPLAVSVSLHSVSPPLRYDLGPDNAWRTIASRRFWFYLPFSHSEDPALHKKFKEELTKGLLEDCHEEEARDGESKGLAMANVFVGFGDQHKAVVDRFGRYPYRNKVLGREDTPEEKIWLGNPGVDWVR